MDWLFSLDGQILLFIQDHIRIGALNGPVRFITALGDSGLVWIALTLVLLFIPKTRRQGAMCAAALLLGLLFTNIILKNMIQRIRPYDVMDALNILIETQPDYSFPSGHSTSSLAAGWTMWRTLPRKYGIPALLLAVLISLSRLYVGVHYPTDVLCGAAIGMLAGEIAIRGINRLVRPKAQ